ncbi:MAG: hypothetical protein U0805_19130 [Pirellulales bacterium]
MTATIRTGTTTTSRRGPWTIGALFKRHMDGVEGFAEASDQLRPRWRRV